MVSAAGLLARKDSLTVLSFKNIRRYVREQRSEPGELHVVLCVRSNERLGGSMFPDFGR
jgi:hypothetical protein